MEKYGSCATSGTAGGLNTGIGAGAGGEVALRCGAWPASVSVAKPLAMAATQQSTCLRVIVPLRVGTNAASSPSKARVTERVTFKGQVSTRSREVGPPGSGGMMVTNGQLLAAIYRISPGWIVLIASLAAGIKGFKSSMSFVGATKTTNAKSNFFRFC